MLLSRIHLSPEAVSSHDLGPMLASPYRLHQAIWSLFADHADRRRDFLYRVDWDSGRPLLWTLSDRPPRPMLEPWEAQTRELNPILRAGERLRFSLRANPVVTRDRKRHDVVMEAKRSLRASGLSKVDWPTDAQLAQEHGAAWLVRRAEARGFDVEPGEVLVDSYEVHTFKKPRGEDVRFATCDFHGLLTVTDADVFLHTLHQGLGAAKGFGCGLFLIRRAAA
ncbi:MAG TPA: type I-E CRISPR-associated protein Cas6/Cse3/CasE [Thermoanaerobaculia bacterium]|jgi:CRISPR system Cascade subunit CasE|nr:type I-E CRISPR-associated protein Cas6/Cse3/CasE [Thermoanaerobaculia bacterium]